MTLTHCDPETVQTKRHSADGAYWPLPDSEARAQEAREIETARQDLVRARRVRAGERILAASLAKDAMRDRRLQRWGQACGFLVAACVVGAVAAAIWLCVR